jgi:hypothetical protein
MHTKRHTHTDDYLAASNLLLPTRGVRVDLVRTDRLGSAARHLSHAFQTQVTQYQVLHPGLLHVAQETAGHAAYSGVDLRSRC